MDKQTQEQKLFPGQEEEERVFLLIRKHWFNYVIFFLVAILMLLPVAGLIFVYYTFTALFTPVVSLISIMMLSAYLLFLLGVQLYGFVSFYLDVYVVTDRRLVDIRQNGFFRREISELNLRQIQDVNAKVEGIFATLFHFGDVIVQTAAEIENFNFISIPHPYTIAKQIIDLHERQLQTRPLLADNLNTYPEYEDNNLSYEALESQAKDVIKQSSLRERLKNPGVFKPKPEAKVITGTVEKPKSPKGSPSGPEANAPKKLKKKPKKSVPKIIKPVKLDSAEEEGVLNEGKEIDLK